jgi:putative DNA primase/helicase
VTPTPTTLLEVALAWHAQGVSVVPARSDGSKAPAAVWKQYQLRRPTIEELTAWFAQPDVHGLGLVCGKVSGNLEMLELEARAVTEQLLAELEDLADNSGLGELWRRVVKGYCELTPTGGLHLLYRISDGPAAPNTKLARRPATDVELATDPNPVRVLVETRGEGGFVVVAPSAGPVHPTGAPWQVVTGGPDTVPVLTADERDALYTLARTCDRTPDPPAADPAFDQPGTVAGAGGLSPGDDYNGRADWSDILTPAGWRHVYTRGPERYWRRPGKTAGVSATTGYGAGDWLYVFSTSTVFESQRTYTKFAATTALDHGGDYRACAAALRHAGYGTPPPEQPRPAAATATVAGEPVSYSLTDDGNALRLVDTHAETLRYVPERGAWLVWDGHRWRYDSPGLLHELIRTIARDLPVASKEQQRHRHWSLSTRGTLATARLAQTDRRIVAPLPTLDARPWELNTPAGPVDLRTGAPRPPDPAALHTRSTSVAPDPDTVPERWLRFLADTFAGDPAMTGYVQRLLGVSLVGAVLEQVLPFAHGEGANGKTTLLGTVQRVAGLGDDGYAISAPAELLLATQSTGHPTEVARLAGARLVVTSELDDGQRFAEARVKLLTGRDVISGRFMRQDFFTFTPTHSLWLLGNHQPAVRTGGQAFWRRIRLIPFLHTVPPDRRIPDLEDQLVTHEGPAILNWLIAGAAHYATTGLDEPAGVRAATESYAHDQDTVARFTEDRCHLADPNTTGNSVRVAELRNAYETWCRTEGETPVSARALTITLRNRYGVESTRDMNARYYVGIRLNTIDQGHDPAPELSSEPSFDQPADPDPWWQK